MASNSSTPQRAALARLLATSATVLPVVVACKAMSRPVPARLLDPLWQLQLSDGLITLGPVALIGFFLMPLATGFDPAKARIARHGSRVQSGGLLAVIGDLLLIPLQGIAVVQGVAAARRSVARQWLEAQRRVDDLRLAVQSARSPGEQQERLAALKAPPIRLNSRALAMPALKRRSLDSLSKVETQLRQSSPVPPAAMAAAPPGQPADRCVGVGFCARVRFWNQAAAPWNPAAASRAPEPAGRWRRLRLEPSPAPAHP